MVKSAGEPTPSISVSPLRLMLPAVLAVRPLPPLVIVRGAEPSTSRREPLSVMLPPALVRLLANEIEVAEAMDRLPVVVVMVLLI